MSLQSCHTLTHEDRLASIQSTAVTETKDSIKLVERIEASGRMIYLAYSTEAHWEYIMKIFEPENEKMSSSYLNESRFRALRHQNINSIVKTVDKCKMKLKGRVQTVSFILKDMCYCNFSQLLGTQKIHHDEKLARTYFHHLVEGIQYLHSNKVCHLDISPENLLLGEDFMLKITDFDQAFLAGDEKLIGKGSKHYRAPERRLAECEDPEKMDIFSLGLMLFAMKTGNHAYFEDVEVSGYNFYEILLMNPGKFWEAHAEVHKESRHLNNDFKKLFMSMVSLEPENRISVEEIKRNKWYQGPVYKDHELAEVMKHVVV